MRNCEYTAERTEPLKELSTCKQFMLGSSELKIE